MKHHPYAELFPMLDDAELKDMAADIKVNGLQEHIVTYEGMILDGRNRHRACELARVNPTFTPFKGKDALAFVLSKNLHRRHLNASQRAIAAAEIANLKNGQKTSSANLPSTPVTQPDAAAKMHVSTRAVTAAKKLIDEKPEEVAAVKAGKKTVHAALATPPKEKPPTQGQQKADVRLFSRMENDLGVILRKLDALHKSFPHKAHHENAIQFVKDCMATVKTWSKSK